MSSCFPETRDAFRGEQRLDEVAMIAVFDSTTERIAYVVLCVHRTASSDLSPLMHRVSLDEEDPISESKEEGSSKSL